MSFVLGTPAEERANGKKIAERLVRIIRPFRRSGLRLALLDADTYGFTGKAFNERWFEIFGKVADLMAELEPNESQTWGSNFVIGPVDVLERLAVRWRREMAREVVRFRRQLFDTKDEPMTVLST